MQTELLVRRRLSLAQGPSRPRQYSSPSQQLLLRQRRSTTHADYRLGWDLDRANACEPCNTLGPSGQDQGLYLYMYMYLRSPVSLAYTHPYVDGFRFLPSVHSTSPSPRAWCTASSSHQIRLLGGGALTHTFKPTDTLLDVRQHILLTQEGPNVPFSLMTNFPKKVFSSDDMNKTLKELGRTLPLAVVVSMLRCSLHLSFVQV